MSVLGEYKMFDNLHIERNEWHQLANEGESPLKIVEIQYGESCIEDDIERLEENI
jgi:mannose-6-phosphate isomerase-like protein (cupin superfamily)